MRPTTYMPEVMVMRNVSATMLRIVRKMRRRSASRCADMATPPRRDVRPGGPAREGHNTGRYYRHGTGYANFRERR